MKQRPPKQMAMDMLNTHGPINEEGESHALRIVRRYTKPEVVDEKGNVVRKNPSCHYWQQVEKEMLATVGIKYRRPRTEEEKRKARAEKAHRIEQKRLKRRKKKAVMV